MSTNSISITDFDLYRMPIAFSCAILVFGIVLGAMNPYVYLIFLLIPIILTFKAGVELDVNKMQYRKFKSFLGQRNGTAWKSYSAAHQLVVLTKNGSKSLDISRVLGASQTTGSYYELYIMDPTHQKRLFLFSHKNKEKINELIAQLTEQTPLRLATYNPPTSRRH